MKKKVLSVIALVVCMLGLGFAVWYQDAMEISTKENIVLEFGEAIPDDVEYYADLGSLAKRKAVLDISQVDNMKVGTYEVLLETGDDEKTISVAVRDTRKPEIKLKNSKFEVMEGQELPASEIIEQVTDLSGIHSVTFRENVVTQDNVTLNEEGVPDLQLKYDNEGEYENAVIAEDNNGTKQEVNFTVDVRADYTAHIQGISDIVLEQGETYDWMSGITYDNRIKEVDVNADAVNMDVPGEYEIIYILTGDDESKTEIRKKVTVEEKWIPSAEEVKVLIVQFYNNQSATDGNYVIADPVDEFVETDTEYRAVVRYQMSDAESEAIIRSGRTHPGANILYTTVNVSKTTWLAQDDLGNSWYIF